MRLTALLAIALAFGFVAVSPVLAAVPLNDNSGNATVVSSFPYVSTVDMSQATIQADEPYCGGQTGSVWYRYTATAEQTLTVTVTAQEPTTRVCVFRDSISVGTYRIIQPSETVPILLDGGHTYYILLGVTDGAPSATIDLAIGPPFFDLQVTVNPNGIADRVSGAAIVSGTLRCSAPATADLFVRVVEKVGSKKTADMTDLRLGIDCPTTAVAWQMVIHAPLAYVPGSATVSILACAGGDVDEFNTSVRLRAK